MSTSNQQQNNTQQQGWIARGVAWAARPFKGIRAPSASQGGQGNQGEAPAISGAPYAVVGAAAKDAFTILVGGFAPFVIMVILTISAGYYFNSLRPFTGDVQSVVAYGTAAIVEAGNLALFFVSAKAFWSGKRAHFITALICGLALTAISVIAQVLYLSNNLDQASLGQGASILSTLPLFGSLALHLVEFCCSYVIARSAVSHRKIIQAQQEQQEAELALLEARQYAAFKRALHDAQMAQLETLRQGLLGGRVIESEGAPLLPFRASNGAASNGASNGNGRQKTRTP